MGLRPRARFARARSSAIKGTTPRGEKGVADYESAAYASETKKQLWTCCTLFLFFFVHFFVVVFARLQRETSETSSFQYYVFLFTFFSMPLIFTLVAASISPFSHRRYKIFMFFFQRNWSPLFFISRSSSSSLIHVNEDIKIKSKQIIS